jgi:hypothetical protein
LCPSLVLEARLGGLWPSQRGELASLLIASCHRSRVCTLGSVRESRAIPFDHRVRVPDHVATRDLDGELVLLNYDSEAYFGLDEVGTRIWSVLRDAPSIEAGIALLLEEFDVADHQLRDDVGQLLGRLLESGLVELDPV